VIVCDLSLLPSKSQVQGPLWQFVCMCVPVCTRICAPCAAWPAARWGLCAGSL